MQQCVHELLLAQEIYVIFSDKNGCFSPTLFKTVLLSLLHTLVVKMCHARYRVLRTTKTIHLFATMPEILLPKVTVVTICFNAEQFIRPTLESVLAQDYPNIEYLVVDGGSKDATPDIIRHHSQHHNDHSHTIAWWVSERDSGVSEAFNKGIKRSTGEYLGFMNAGDYFYSNHALSELIHATVNVPAVLPDIIYGKARLTFDPPLGGAKEKIVGSALRPAHKLPTAHQAMYYHRRVWERYGLFSMDYRYAMDYEHYLRYDNSLHYAFADVIVAERPLTMARNSFGNPSRTYREYIKADIAHKNLGVAANVAKFVRDRLSEQRKRSFKP
jgi:glycosyltransferase involved in cell wall biosynthesis